MENKNNEQFAISVDAALDMIYETVYLKLHELELDDKKVYNDIIVRNLSNENICKVVSDIILVNIKYRNEEYGVSKIEGKNGYTKETDFVEILQLKNSDPTKFTASKFEKMAKTVLNNHFIIPAIRRIC